MKLHKPSKTFIGIWLLVGTMNGVGIYILPPDNILKIVLTGLVVVMFVWGLLDSDISRIYSQHT